MKKISDSGKFYEKIKEGNGTEGYSIRSDIHESHLWECPI